MFGIPRPTPLDLQFTLFGVPVTVSVWHWLMAGLIGYQISARALPAAAPGATVASHVAIAALCIFFSILLHEMGHALIARLFGMERAVILLLMGGLAYGPRRQGVKWWQDVLVSLAGPFAQLLLAGLLFAGWAAAELLAGGVRMSSPLALTAAITLMYVNILWPLFNLLPIFPLDGGQVMRAVFVRFLRSGGELWTARVSLFVAVMLGALALVFREPFFIIFFGMFAFQNYQMMQAFGRR